jgi:hypothetical protein
MSPHKVKELALELVMRRGAQLYQFALKEALTRSDMVATKVSLAQKPSEDQQYQNSKGHVTARAVLPVHTVRAVMYKCI